tara:strand:+ start:2297 stop:2578 length:282 start_codon:yes stop_codon:yes gene_type:complete
MGKGTKLSIFTALKGSSKRYGNIKVDDVVKFRKSRPKKLCGTKKRFLTWEEASQSLSKILQYNDSRMQEPYYCVKHRCYHLGHTDNGFTKGEK